MTALADSERRLVEVAAAGETLRLAAGDEVRAELVRDLLLGRHGAPLPRGVSLRGGRVTGRLDLEGLRLGLPLRLVECSLLDGLWLRGASFALLDLRRSRLSGLSVTEAEIDRVLLLSGITVDNGRVDLDGARVGAAVSLREATVRNSQGPAVVADRLRLDSELLLDGLVAYGVGVQGAVTLVGARINGRLSARGLHAENPSGPAFVADSMQVADTVDLSHRAVLHGTGEAGAVRLVGARAASISLSHATLGNPSGWAVAAAYVDVRGTIYLDSVRSSGGVRVAGARILGGLNLLGATVDGSAGREAIDATRVQVGQAVRMEDAAFRCAGDVAALDLRSARIAGDLDLRHTRVANPGGVALRLNTATVDGRAILSELVVERGGLDFRDTAVGAFYDDPASALPDEDGFVELTGLTYRGVPGHPAVALADRLAWLSRMPRYSAQPYRQLAAAYQATGHEDEARRVLVAQQEHLHRSGTLTEWGRFRHRMFGLTLQYGYQPARAVALLAAVLAVAVGLFLGLPGGTRTPAGTGCPAVDRVGLAVDAAIPLVSTGAADRCQLATDTAAGQGLAAAGWLITLLGWAAATLVVAGYSGWVRRR